MEHQVLTQVPTWDAGFTGGGSTCNITKLAPL